MTGDLRGVVMAPRWTAVVLAIAVASAAWPILSVRHLPLVDYPQHLALLSALHFDGDPRYAPYYEIHPLGAKYVLFYLAGDLLAHVVGVEAAGRGIVALSLALLPISVAAWLAAHRRPALLGGLAVLVAFHLYVFWGFVGHVLGVPLALLALAAHQRFVEMPSRVRGVVFAIAAILALSAHPLAFAWTGLGCAIQIAAFRPRAGVRGTGRLVGKTLLAASPALVALLPFALRFSERADVRATVAVPEVSLAQARWQSLAEAIDRAPLHAFGYYGDGSGMTLGWLLLAAVACFAGMRLLGERRRAPLGLAPELLFGTTLLLYLVVPIELATVHLVGVRLLPLALALAAALGPTVLDGVGKRLIAGCVVVVASGAVLGIHGPHLRAADQEFVDLRRVLREAESGRRLLGLVYEPRSAVVATPVFLHAAQYYVVDRGGFAGASFASSPTRLVRVRPGVEPEHYPSHFDWRPDRFELGTLGPFFDYFLVRSRRADDPDVPWKPAPDAPRLLVREGRWSLYEREVDLGNRSSAP